MPLSSNFYDGNGADGYQRTRRILLITLYNKNIDLCNIFTLGRKPRLDKLVDGRCSVTPLNYKLIFTDYKRCVHLKLNMGPIPKSKLAKRKGKSNASRSTGARPPVISPPSKGVKRRSESQPGKEEEPDTQLVFDDPYGDDFEKEDEAPGPGGSNSNGTPSTQDRPVIFQPGKHSLSDGEALVCDETAYDVFYKCNVEWPSLSFDFICTRQDGEYSNVDVPPLNDYPLSVSLVLGTQADHPSNNKLVFIRMTNLHRNRNGKSNRPENIGRDENSDSEDSAEEDSDDEDDDADGEDPLLSRAIDRNGVLQSSEVKADATVNRVRVMPQRAGIVAYWSENGRFTLVDGTPALNTLYLDNRSRMQAPTTPSPSSIRPFYSSKIHGCEGFALDWSRTVPGRLLSGAVNGGIYLSQPSSESAAEWMTCSDRYRGHTSSVEDLQWSPNERDVFCSCSCDKSIRVWDVREYRKAALGIKKAHSKDVNVISWNRMETHLLGSGGDDGVIKVWDLRSLKEDPVNEDARPAAEFAMHQKAITAIQWHPTDASMLCASSEDGSVSVWDLAVERDAEEEVREGVIVDGAEDLPPQLLFVHMGQKNVKEAQWHPGCQSLIVSSAEDGLNVFQPCNIAHT